MNDDLRALLLESALYHRITAPLFDTLPEKQRTKHLADKARALADRLEAAANDISTYGGE